MQFFNPVFNCCIEIIIKPADKGSIIVIMSPDYYWNICQSHISDTSYYRMLNDTDPSNIVQKRVMQFADKYKSMLTLKEYNYLTKRKYKISNLYMLPKLHKSKRINEIAQKQQCEYINIEENIIVEARPIVAGPVYHTSRISEIFLIITGPSLAMISLIAKDSFDFKNRLNKHCPNETTLNTCDIKSYALTFDMLFFIHQLNTGLKNCKTIYHECDVSKNSIIFT